MGLKPPSLQITCIITAGALQLRHYDHIILLPLRFKTLNEGTDFYHAHIGNQRTQGLFGPLITLPAGTDVTAPSDPVMILNDWNHDYDSNGGE